MAKQDIAPVKRALISVSDKTGIVDFAKGLNALGIEILSTGGTFRLLADQGIHATEVSDYTGFPEMMDGRVKTLHPRIHGGILGRRGQDDDIMAEQGIGPIDLVVVNLYPFMETVAKPDCDLPTAIENIDIGGPAMIRSAAKNHPSVTVVVNAADYAEVLAELQQAGGLDHLKRFRLAVKAFEHTSAYDGAIANYLGTLSGPDTHERAYFARTLNVQLHHNQEMRYGENPHQRAAFYVAPDADGAMIATARQIQGKALSYNNIADADTALECVRPFADPACVIVKHANPCGVAIGSDLCQAYKLAYSTDTTSAFGGIIAFNRELDATTAKTIIDQQFAEVIIAPAVSPGAIKVLQAKKNLRVLETGTLSSEKLTALEFKQVNGGLLVQDRDTGMVNEDGLKMVTTRTPTEQEISDLLFAWEVAKFVKSNAIVYARQGRTIGIGAGQMSRIYSARIAGMKAEDEGLRVADSVMASDAFFPFRDSVDAAAKAGITAIIQPGGSMRDDEVIAAANEHNIAMVFTGMRHFRH